MQDISHVLYNNSLPPCELKPKALSIMTKVNGRKLKKSLLSRKARRRKEALLSKATALADKIEAKKIKKSHRVDRRERWKSLY